MLFHQGSMKNISHYLPFSSSSKETMVKTNSYKVDSSQHTRWEEESTGAMIQSSPTALTLLRPARNTRYRIFSETFTTVLEEVMWAYFHSLYYNWTQIFTQGTGHPHDRRCRDKRGIHHPQDPYMGIYFL